MCESLHYLLDNVFIRFVSKLHVYRQIVGIPMGTNWALVADLFCDARDFMLSVRQ